MDDSRLNQKVHRWMCNKRGYRCKIWSYRFLKQLEKFNIQENSDNAADFINAMLLDYKAKGIPLLPHFHYIKVGYTGVFISRTCLPD